MAQKMFEIDRRDLQDVGWVVDVHTYGMLLRLTVLRPFVRDPERFLEVHWPQQIYWLRKGDQEAKLQGSLQVSLRPDLATSEFTTPLTITMAKLAMGFLEVQICRHQSPVYFFDRAGRLAPWVTVGQLTPQTVRVLLLDGRLNIRWHQEPICIGLLFEQGDCSLPKLWLYWWQRWTLRRLRRQYEDKSYIDSWFG